MSSNQSYHHGNLKEALVKAATELLEEGTPASDLSLRMVARRAGVSHAAPYAHFEDKEDLIASIKDEAFGSMLEELKEKLGAVQKDPTKKLVILARTYLAFAGRNPGKFDLMFRRPLQKTPKPGHKYAESGMAMFSILTNLVKDLVGPKNSDEALIKNRTVLAWSALHGLCMLRVGGLMIHVAPERKFEEIAEEIVSQMLDLIKVVS